MNGFHTTGRSGLPRGLGSAGSNGCLTIHHQHARSNSLVNNQTGDGGVVLPSQPSASSLLPFEDTRVGPGAGLSSTASLGRVSKQQLTTTTTITSSSKITTTVQKRGPPPPTPGAVVAAPSPSPVVVDISPGGLIGATTDHHPHHHHLLQMGPDGQPMEYEKGKPNVQLLLFYLQVEYRCQHYWQLLLSLSIRTTLLQEMHICVPVSRPSFGCVLK